MKVKVLIFGFKSHKFLLSFSFHNQILARNKMVPQVFVTCVFLISEFSFILGNPSQDIPSEINRCLSADKHKLTPMPNTNDLAGECKPWTERSCCDNERANSINSDTEDIFNLHKNLCANMTEKCKNYFRKETCFFECSPNIGLWFEKMNSSDDYQRFRNVPLCKKDCDEWYNACAEDLTCSQNWYANEKTCDSNKKCTKIGKMFKTAKDFCEKVWDNSYKVMENDENCMTFSFDPKNNPNEEVAMKFYQQKNSAPITNNYVLVIIMFLVPFF